MANSGSFSTEAKTFDGITRYLTFAWEIASQSIDSNSTKISWTLKGAGGSSTTNWVWSAPFSLTINGTKVYSSNERIQLHNGTVVSSGTTTIPHNADGTKSFTASAEAAIYAYAINSTGSGTFSLPTINREVELKSATNFAYYENPKITYDNPAGSGISSLQARIADSSGTTIVAYRDISKTGTSYTFVLTDSERKSLIDLVPSGSTSIPIRFYIKYGTSTKYLSRQFSFEHAKLTGGKSIQYYESPTAYYNNPAGDKGYVSLAIGIRKTSGDAIVAYSSASETATSKTITLSESQRDNLIALAPSGGIGSFRYYLQETICGNTYYSHVDATITNSIPTIESVADFIHTTRPTVYYKNPLGTSVSALQMCISATNSDSSPAVPYRDISKVKSGSYQFSSSDLATLVGSLSSTAKTKTFYFFIQSTVGGITKKSYSTAKMTLVENSDTKPTLTVTDSINNTGFAPISGKSVIVKGKSKYNVSISASGKSGASIASIVTTIGNKTFTGNSVTDYVFSDYGSHKVIVKVTDSRGFTNTYTATKTVLNYTKPSIIPPTGISKVSMYRVDASGAKSSSGEKIHLDARKSYSKLTVSGTDLNTCHLRWRYKPYSQSSYEAWTDYADSRIQVSGNISGDFTATNAFNFQVGVIDGFGEHSEMSFSVPADGAFIDAPAGGKWLGVGRYADTSSADGALSIGWNTTIDGSLRSRLGVAERDSGNPYWAAKKGDAQVSILTNGSDSGVYSHGYSKWLIKVDESTGSVTIPDINLRSSDGFFILGAVQVCYGTITATMGKTTASGSIYYYDSTDITGDYARAFRTAPSVVYVFKAAATSTLISAEYSSGTASKITGIRVKRSTASTTAGSSVSFNYIAIGES